ncbi:MAG: histidinol-phosphate transaminase [Oscillospiraceae bacterium]|nr:histidinol-phosphate transaminase [Oscillospiraceae bacterium]
MSRFLSEKFASLAPYVPGEQPRDMKYLKLNTNESPFPPSKKVIEVINADNAAYLRLYPDPTGHDLVEALSEVYKLPAENIYVTGGSDEALYYAFLAYCDEKTPVVFPEVSYGFYPVLADLLGIKAKRIPLREGFRLEPEDYYDAGGTVVIANPNAPTGRAIGLDAIREICRRNENNVVVIDEAYVDFGAESAVRLLPECPNLLVVQTFSKSRCLAGARIGFSAAAPDMIEDLVKLKFSINPYDLTRLSIDAGAAAVRDVEYFDECRGKIISARKYTTEALRATGFEVIDSMTNFLFASPVVMSGEEFYLEMKKRGVLVRYFGTEKTKNYVRITIGAREDMERFCAVASQVVKEAGK